MLEVVYFFFYETGMKMKENLNHPFLNFYRKEPSKNWLLRMIQTRKIKNLVKKIKQILNNSFQDKSIDKVLPFNLYAQYLLIYGFIETRNWLEHLSSTIIQELINDSWNVCIGDARSDNFYENYRKIDGNFSNKLKKIVNVAFIL